MEKYTKFELNNRYSGMKKQSRTILNFENGIKSSYTRNMYRSRLNAFVKYFEMDIKSSYTFDELVKIPIIKLKEMVEDYVMFRKSKGLAFSTINNDVCALSLFFVMNEIEVPCLLLKYLLRDDV